IGASEPALAGHLEYATGVWGRTEADRFAAGFTAAAGELAAAVSTPVAELRCLPAAQRALLAATNETRRDLPGTSLDELFRAVVRRTPDAPAVRDGDTALTYAQLAAAVAEQARLLRQAGVRPGARVLVGLERSVAEVVAVLGAVRAGAAYVGIDLSQPAAHLSKIITTAAPAAALVAAESVDRLAPYGIPVVPAWQPGWSAAGPVDPPPDPPAADPGRLAYVAFTSGSTGTPKGVSVPHGAVIRLVHEVDYVRL